MSELINRIYDLEAISKEVAEIKKYLTGVEKDIQDFSDNVKKISESVRMSKSFDDLVKSSNELNNTFTKGQKPLKDWQTQVAELEAKTKLLTDTEKQANIEIAKARLELQAAQKATKEAALAQIELEAKTKGVAQNYYTLKAELKSTEKAFKTLTLEEQKSAKGRELMDKFNDLKKTLNATDESFGNFQHNVGNYEKSIVDAANSINGMKKQLKDLTDKLNGMDVDSQEFKDTKRTVDELTLAVGQAEGKIDEFGNKEPKNIAKKNFEDTMVTVSILSSSINALSSSFGDNEATQEALTKATQALTISQSVANVVKEKGAIVDTIVLAKEKALALGKIILTNLTRIFGLTSVQAWAAATLGVSLLITGITLLIANFDSVINAVKSFFGITNEFAETEAKINKLSKAMEGFAESTQLVTDRMKAEGKSDQEILNYKKKRYDEELAMNRQRFIELKKITRKLTDDEKSQLEESAKFVKNSTAEKYKFYTERVALNRAANKQIEDDNKKAADAQKALTDKIIAAQRRLTDSAFAITKESREKELKVSQESYRRQIEDLERNGDLTTELKKNIQQAQRNAADKINKDWNAKDLQEAIKADELTLENMKRSGEDTLAFEKKLLKKRMDAEIAAGGDINEIRIKYQYLSIDLETQNAEKKAELFQKALTKEIDLLKQGYSLKEKELKKQYANGEIDRETYENKLAKLTLDAQTDANQKTIDLLKKQLASNELTADKRAELSNQLTDLEIQNEALKLDAVIDANEKKTESDKQRFENAKQIATELLNASMEVFTSIADFQKQQSENRIAELEKELEASQSNFDDEQAILDGAIMSDESRAEQQKIINEKKAAADKAIQDKIVAEKIKMAKWEKAQAIISAIISTAQAVAGALAVLPWSPLNAVFAGLAATSGAVQVATIASQPLPAYEKGTDNHPGGWSLWGEKRAEVAVLPTGKTYLAEKPTVTNFDPGTKIFKSVSDYENYMLKQNLNEVVFDYYKFGEKMPQTNINLDGNGLWEIVNKKNQRRKILNRRYKR